MATLPSDFSYSEDHEWINAAADSVVGSTVRVGITSVATDRLGEVVFAELPAVGDTVEHGETCGEVESTKSVSDLFCPVPGSVTETNEEIVDSPELVNSDPFGAAWLFKVKVTEIPDDLLDKAAYDELTKEA